MKAKIFKAFLIVAALLASVIGLDSCEGFAYVACAVAFAIAMGIALYHIVKLINNETEAEYYGNK